MNVALTGGSGFVGRYLVEALLDAGHSPSLLVRSRSQHKMARVADCRIVTGDVRDEAALDRLASGMDALIYNVGLLRESPGSSFEQLQWRCAEMAMRAAERAGVRQFILMSAVGARADGTAYQRTKFLAERSLRESALEWTIFRPSVIFGDPRGADEIASRLLRELVGPPVPAIAFRTGIFSGPESVRMSPVHVLDVATAFVHALGNTAMHGRTIELGGPEALSWRVMIERIAATVGRRKLFLPMPIPLMRPVAAALGRFAWFPVTADQLAMLAEGNTADPAPLAGLIGRAPLPFDTRTLAYLRPSATP